MEDIALYAASFATGFAVSYGARKLFSALKPERERNAIPPVPMRRRMEPHDKFLFHTFAPDRHVTIQITVQHMPYFHQNGKHPTSDYYIGLQINSKQQGREEYTMMVSVERMRDVDTIIERIMEALEKYALTPIDRDIVRADIKHQFTFIDFIHAHIVTHDRWVQAYLHSK